MKTSSWSGRTTRGLVVSAILASFMLGVAGRLDLPMLNAFVAVCVTVTMVAVFVIDPELARERLRRGQRGEDPVRLALIRGLLATTLALALLDIGRLHWSDSVPRGLQLVGLVAAPASFTWILWAIAVNRFFVPVVRVQPERGHRVVDAGPYAQVRHPGYAGMAIAGPAIALALGSWSALAPALAASWLFLRRAAHEDRFLRANLEGYEAYAGRVRYRLVPGVW